jgi:hypothetical protein
MISAKRYIKNYFHGLFIKRDLSTIEKYLDKNHFDYDIGTFEKDHITNSKKYLSELFKNKPSIQVKVLKVKSIGNIICAKLRWYETINNLEKTWLEGVATFYIKDKKILKGNTLIYIANSK